MRKILLGGYTSKENKGIAEIAFSEEKETLEERNLLLSVGKPTYLMEKGGRIFSCVEMEGKGGMAMIENAEIKAVCLKEGASPCHISSDVNGDYFYLSNYHEGTISVVKKTANDLEEICCIHHIGSSVHPNQEKAHVHFAELCPRGRYLFVCDLGCDEVYLYLPQENGQLVEHLRYRTPAGFGPRHLCFHPEKAMVYVLGELSNQILVLQADTETGNLIEKQRISMLPEDFQGESAGAAIRISLDGKFLYASNRGHDSIVVYRVSEEGLLEMIQHISTCGSFPRDFALSPDENYVVAANQKTDNLTLYRRDKESGQLELLQKDVSAPECVCVCFEKEKEVSSCNMM